jgi:hypothetical protein
VVNRVYSVLPEELRRAENPLQYLGYGCLDSDRFLLHGTSPEDVLEASQK